VLVTTTTVVIVIVVVVVVVIVVTGIDLSSFRLSLSSSFYLWHSHIGHVLSFCLRFLAST